jgi:hypothetical protein
MYLPMVGSAARNPWKKCVDDTLQGETAVNRPVRIPSYRLHKPSGQAIVVIRGKMIDLGRYGSVDSRAEYGRIIAEWQAGTPEMPSGSTSKTAMPSALTVAELFLGYFRHCEQYYVKNGEVTN